jgi:hypothetical protein
MRYTTRQVESARTKVIEMENRAADQRRIVDELMARGQPMRMDGRSLQSWRRAWSR